MINTENNVTTKTLLNIEHNIKVEECAKKKNAVDKNMRNAVIRISKVNIMHQDYPHLGLKKGDKLIITREEVLEKLEAWAKTRKMDWFFVEHNEDENNIHYHCVIIFGSNSEAKFSTVKNKFKFGQIKQAANGYGITNCVKYLIHALNPDKYQYAIEDVVTNNRALLERYLILGSNSEKKLCKKTCDMIIEGRIREYEIDKINPNIYIKHKNKIENAFEYRRKIIASDPNRCIDVYYLEGDTGLGKTTFCKAWAKLHNSSIAISNSGAHAIESYRGEDILVFDDSDFELIPLEESKNCFDNHTAHEIAVRYKKVQFIGNTIMIANNKSIFDLYPKEADKTALYRRIKYVFRFDHIDDYVSYYSVNKIHIKSEAERNRDQEILRTRSYDVTGKSEKEIEQMIADLQRDAVFVKIADKTFDLKPYITIRNETDVTDDLLNELDKM